MIQHLFPSQSLRTKLIVAFLALVLLPLVGTGLYGNFFTSQVLAQQVREDSVHQVNLQAAHIVNELERVRSDVLYLANLRSLQSLRALYNQNAPEEQITHWRAEVAQDFLVLSAARPMYYQIRYIDALGMETVRVDFDGHIARIIPDDALQNKGHRYYFQEAMALPAGGIFVSPLDLNREHGQIEIPYQPVIRFATKLSDNDGIVIINLYASWLLNDLSYNNGVHTWALVDQDGYFLSHPDERLRWGSPNDLGHGARLQTEHPDAVSLLDGRNGILETASHAFVYTTIYPVANNPRHFWVLYRATPTSILFSSIADFRWTALSVLLGAFLMALVLALILSSQIVAPIRELQHKVENFGRGGPAPPLSERVCRDEIGALTRAFHQMAQELERKRKEQHALIEQLINAQEEERKLLAYDLHDGLIQQMVGARFHLTMCREHCSIEADRAQEGLRRGCDALSDAIIEGRRIIEGLRPAILDDLGLVAALEEVARSAAQAAGWTLQLNLAELTCEPDNTLSVTLYRIAQEALNNIRKHAAATTVSMSLSCADGLTLTIHDDGQGFDPNALANNGSHHVGLAAMQERASLLGGVCVIKSAPGGGTTVTVHVPLVESEVA